MHGVGSEKSQEGKQLVPVKRRTRELGLSGVMLRLLDKFSQTLSPTI